MKEARVSRGPRVQIVEAPIPEPAADQVCIRVVYAGSNPKDWKYGEALEEGLNTGDDIAGLVHSVGKEVVEFQPNQRVAAFHVMFTPGGSFAEYAIAPASTTFHVPQKIPLAEAATIPLAALTAAVGLYSDLMLPLPWVPTREKTPIIIWGASSAVGAFSIKLAGRSNIHPVIAIGGNGKAFVESLLDEAAGDTFVDYRNGSEAVVRDIKAALQKAGVDQVHYALDAISEHGSFQTISKVMSSGQDHIALILPDSDYSEIPPHITKSVMFVGIVHDQKVPQREEITATMRQANTRGKDFGLVFSRLFAQGLAEGWFSGHPYKVVEDGLAGLETALSDLKAGKASASKFVFKIGDEF